MMRSLPQPPHKEGASGYRYSKVVLLYIEVLDFGSGLLNFRYFGFSDSEGVKWE